MSSVGELRDAITDLRRVGEQMSNVCFNLGQHAATKDLSMVSARELDVRSQRIMYECYKAWDAAVAKHRIALTPQVRRITLRKKGRVH